MDEQLTRSEPPSLFRKHFDINKRRWPELTDGTEWVMEGEGLPTDGHGRILWDMQHRPRTHESISNYLVYHDIEKIVWWRQPDKAPCCDMAQITRDDLGIGAAIVNEPPVICHSRWGGDEHW